MNFLFKYLDVIVAAIFALGLVYFIALFAGIGWLISLFS